MKKFFCVFLSVIVLCLSIPVSASADLADASSFAIDTVLQYCDSLINQYQSAINKEIVAARTFYFYCILNDYYSSGLTVFDETGHKFSNDILEFYYTQYANTKKSYISGAFGGSGTSNDIYNSDGDVFMQAAGSSSPWSLSKCSFSVNVDALKAGYFGDWDKPYFKQYYNTELARFLLESGQSVSDPNPGKSGLEIAPAYVSSDELIEGLERDNKMFFPKSYEAKISYRTDDNYQRYVSSLSNQNNAYYYRPFILDNSLFVGTNDAQKMYFTMFADVDGEKYYSEYQFCVWFDVLEVLDDDGNFQSYKKIINLKVWSVIDGSEEAAKTVYTSSFDFSPYKYMILVNEPGIGYCFFAYKKYSDYLADYPRGTLGNMILDYDKLYSPDFTSFDDYTDFWSNSTTNHRFKGVYDTHDSDCCYGGNCDIGILVDSKPIAFTWRDIDTSKIGKGQIVTINGDTIYNYTITNPETGDSSKFGDYITNNYTYITNNNGGSSGGTVGGDVTVGGKIDVGGSVAVDVNVNVNGAGGTSLNPSDFTSGDTVDTKKYFDSALEMSENTQNFLGDFFSFLPPELLALILFGLTMAIVCRVGGR